MFILFVSKIPLKFAPYGPIEDKSALAHVMARRWKGDPVIIWTNGGLVYWRICAPFGFGKLKGKIFLCSGMVRSAMQDENITR